MMDYVQQPASYSYIPQLASWLQLQQLQLTWLAARRRVENLTVEKEAESGGGGGGGLDSLRAASQKKEEQQQKRMERKKEREDMGKRMKIRKKYLSCFENGQ